VSVTAFQEAILPRGAIGDGARALHQFTIRAGESGRGGLPEIDRRPAGTAGNDRLPAAGPPNAAGGGFGRITLKT